MSAEVTGRAAPPAIPERRVAEMAHRREPLLFWVLTGTATVAIGGERHTLDAGQASWIPAGTTHSLSADADSVAFPILLPPVDLPRSLSAPARITVPRGWEDRLIYQFARSLGYLRGSTCRPDALLELVAGALDGTPATAQVSPPPLPRSAAALDVARSLLRTPALGEDIPAWAARARVSPRTLQRQFVEETGYTFGRWRTCARLAAAAAHLADGGEVGWAAHQAGFGTASGFTRAFRQHTDLTPTEYRHRATMPADSTVPARRSTADVAGRGSRDWPSRPEAGRMPIPAHSTWPRVNGFHVAVWVYRGTATTRVGGRTWRLRRGDVMWLPAGIRNSVDVDADSLVLPLGWRPGRGKASVEDLAVAQVPRHIETFLLHTVVACYTPLRPEDHGDDPLAGVVGDPTALGGERDPAMPELVPARRVAAAIDRDPADPRSLADWARQLGVDAGALREAFAAETGCTVTQWRARVRMAVARDLLRDGVFPTAVARRLGYTRLSGFSKVFTAAHGVSPREYQQRELHDE